ncbi:MAG: NYN domain-containing protein [Bdellovibrionales bacterium]|nr:NYN domain-containing protein [Bdellovibrionales bacterium]
MKGDFKQLKDVKSVLRKNLVQFPTHEEKETDVNIATHITYDCCKENVDAIALLSNDTDLKLPLWFARKKLKKKVIIITPTENKKDLIVPMRAHQDLQKISNKTLSLTESHLKNSQFPGVVSGISKPKKWL